MTDAEAWIEEQDEELWPLLRAARKLVHQRVPNATERVYRGWNVLGFRIASESEREHLFCGVYPFKVKGSKTGTAQHNKAVGRRATLAVKLAFERGWEVHDPKGLLQQTGTRMRFVLLTSPKQLTSDVGDLIENAASALADSGPNDAGAITKQKGPRPRPATPDAIRALDRADRSAKSSTEAARKPRSSPRTPRPE